MFAALQVALSAVLPVSLVAGGGYAISRLFRIDVKTLSTLNIYLFLPALVFSLMLKDPVPWGELLRITGASVVALTAGALVLAGAARARGMGGLMRSAFLMTLFVNLGNFGLPMVQFAFGEDGLRRAVLVMMVGMFFQNSVAIYFAQRGRLSIGRAFAKVFAFPVLYAFALALILQALEVGLPLWLDRGVTLLADATIPLQLIILGAQLAVSEFQLRGDVWLAVGIRLLAGPLIAAGAAALTGLTGLPGDVFVVQMSGPVAVGMAMYTVQFEVEPAFMTSVVALSFLLSMVTVSVVLMLVQTGLI